MSSETIEFYFYSVISLSCLYFVLITYYKYCMSLSWNKGIADIVRIKVDKEAQGNYMPGKNIELKSIHIEYQYEVSNKTYIGTKLSVIDDLPMLSNYDSNIHSVIDKLLLSGERLPIYIHPKKYQYSLVSRTFNASKIKILLMVFFAFFMLSLNKYSSLDDFSIFHYLIYIILLAPIVIMERHTFIKNISKEYIESAD